MPRRRPAGEGAAAGELQQQLGTVSLGPVTTVAIVTLAAAGLLIAVAVGWSRRAHAADAGDSPAGDSPV